MNVGGAVIGASWAQPMKFKTVAPPPISFGLVGFVCMKVKVKTKTKDPIKLDLFVFSVLFFFLIIVLTGFLGYLIPAAPVQPRLHT